MAEETLTVLSANEIRYYHAGFLRVLRRYRIMSTLGWVIVLAGFISLLLGWNLGLPHGLIDLALSCLSILAGILVVQQSVAALQEYVSVPFSVAQSRHVALIDIGVLMEEIRRGGWREATAGVRKLEKIATEHGLSDTQPTESSHFFQER